MAATPDENSPRQKEPTESQKVKFVQFTVPRTKIYRMCKGVKRENRKLSEEVKFLIKKLKKRAQREREQRE